VFEQIEFIHLQMPLLLISYRRPITTEFIHLQTPLLLIS